MTPGPVSLTRRGWVLVAIAGVLVVVSATVLVIRGNRPPDCTVVVGGRTVDLDQREADRAAGAVAGVVADGGSSSAAASAVEHVVDVSRTDAQVVSAALTGRARAALTCRHGGAATPEDDRLDARGLTGRAEAVRRDLLAHVGALQLGGFAAGGVSTGHMVGSAHYEGRAIDAFFRPVNAGNKTRGWALAQYLVARAERLSIETVIFDDRIWTARRADEGWRRYAVDTTGKSRPVARILEHRDHVHVDVAD